MVALFTFDFNGGQIVGGTRPFRTGFHFEVGSALDMENVLEDVDDWFTAAVNMRAQLDDSMNEPTLTAQGVFSGVAVEVSKLATDGPTGTAPDLPGVSLRAIKLGNRPPGGRRGSMFWPGLSGSANSADGFVDGPDAVTFKNALDGLLAAIEQTAGAYMVSLHNVGGVTSATAVTEFSIHPKVSFLQRRYT